MPMLTDGEPCKVACDNCRRWVTWHVRREDPGLAGKQLKAAIDTAAIRWCVDDNHPDTAAREAVAF